MAKTKTKTVGYRRAVFSNPDIDLQSALSELLEGDLREAAERRETYTEDAGIFRLINRHKRVSNTLFGQFVSYEPDRKQPLLTIKPHSNFYPLATKGSEANEAFADEVFYFGVRGNHLVTIQTRALTPRILEDHLAWLLGTRTSTMDGDTTLQLINQPAEQVYERAATKHVKSIRVGTNVLTSDRAEGVDNAPARHGKRNFRIVGKAAEVLRSALGVQQYERLSFEEDFDEANLHLYIELKFLRKTTSSGQEAVDKIASSFRHLDDMDYEVELKNGARIKGTDMSIKRKINMRLTDDGLVDENDLYLQMHDFLIDTLDGQGE